MIYSETQGLSNQFQMKKLQIDDDNSWSNIDYTLWYCILYDIVTNTREIVVAKQNKIDSIEFFVILSSLTS